MKRLLSLVILVLNARGYLVFARASVHESHHVLYSNVLAARSPAGLMCEIRKCCNSPRFLPSRFLFRSGRRKKFCVQCRAALTRCRDKTGIHNIGVDYPKFGEYVCTQLVLVPFQSGGIWDENFSFLECSQATRKEMFYLNKQTSKCLGLWIATQHKKQCNGGIDETRTTLDGLMAIRDVLSIHYLTFFSHSSNRTTSCLTFYFICFTAARRLFPSVCTSLKFCQ